LRRTRTPGSAERVEEHVVTMQVRLDAAGPRSVVTDTGRAVPVDGTDVTPRRAVVAVPCGVVAQVRGSAGVADVDGIGHPSATAVATVCWCAVRR